MAESGKHGEVYQNATTTSAASVRLESGSIINGRGGLLTMGTKTNLARRHTMHDPDSWRFRQYAEDENRCSKRDFEAALDTVLPRKGETWALIGSSGKVIDAPIVVGFKTEREAKAFLPSRAGYSVTLFSDITQEARERRGLVRHEDYKPHVSSNPFSF
jgi:hypothetical protein